MANVILRPSEEEMASFGKKYEAIAKSFGQSHHLAIQPGQSSPGVFTSERPDPAVVALVVQFLDPLDKGLVKGLAESLTRQLRRRGMGHREAVFYGPDGKSFQRLRLNS